MVGVLGPLPTSTSTSSRRNSNSSGRMAGSNSSSGKHHNNNSGSGSHHSHKKNGGSNNHGSSHGGGSGGGLGHGQSSARGQNCNNKTNSSSARNGTITGGGASGSGSGGSNNNKAYLLARGWTGRLSLPANLIPLRPDEMEKDLRHMQVYGDAVHSYQQQLFLQTNRIIGGEDGPNNTTSTTTANATGGSSSNAKAALATGGITGTDASAASITATKLGTSQQPAQQHMPLPVRIDPEEEKRLWHLRKKIAAAEVLREQAEQEWVAHQAHYVHMAAVMKRAQQQRRETIQFLQHAVKTRSAVIAQARARLQMTRDVLQALHYRLTIQEEEQQQVLLQPNDEDDKNNKANEDEADQEMPDAVFAKSEPQTSLTGDGDMSNSVSSSTVQPGVQPSSDDTAPQPPTADQPTAVLPSSNVAAATATASSTDGDALTEVWMAAEEEYKRACMNAACGGPGGNGDKRERSRKRSSNSSAQQHQQSLLPWTATKLPATPTNVPLMLSVLSKTPDKVLAYGSDPNSLIWLPHHLRQSYKIDRRQSYKMDEDDEKAEEDDLDGSEGQDTLDNLMTMHEDEIDDNDDLLDSTSRNRRRRLMLEDDDLKAEALRSRIRELEQDLAKERELNVDWSAKMAASRKYNDEWVAMMSVVRQETEGLLHRHNILLESDKALAASEKLHAEDLQTRAAAAAAKAAAEEEEDEEEEEELVAAEPVEEPEATATFTNAAQESAVRSANSQNAKTAFHSTSATSALDAMVAAAEQSSTIPTTTTAEGGKEATGDTTRASASSSEAGTTKPSSTTETTAAITSTGTVVSASRTNSGSINSNDNTATIDEAANDGDDEGSGEAEEEEEWPVASTNTATTGRGNTNEADVEGTNSKKRSNPTDNETGEMASTERTDPGNDGEEENTAAVAAKRRKVWPKT